MANSNNDSDKNKTTTKTTESPNGNATSPRIKQSSLSNINSDATGKEELHVSFNLSNISSTSTNGFGNGSRENSFRIVKPNQRLRDGNEEIIELADAVILQNDEEELMIDESSPENRNSMEWSGSLAEDGEQAELFQELKQDRKERKNQEQWKWLWNMIKETVTVFLPLGLTTFVGGIQIVCSRKKTIHCNKLK